MLGMDSTRKRRNRMYGYLLALGAIAFWAALPSAAPAQQPPPTQTQTAPSADKLLQDAAARLVDEPAQADQSAPDAQVDPTAPPAERVVKDPMSYGLWVLMPAAVAILLAIFTRQVVPALVLGILTGAYMMVPCLPAGGPYGDNAVIGGLRLAAEEFVLGAVVDPADGYGKAKVIIFTLVIGFMVGVISRNGGTAGLVRMVVGDTESPRRGTLTAWLAGLVVFFDDYANSMIVGPTMRPIFDRLKISRAKLAYIVDSTAAPVASIALVGTWVGAEITYINNGLTDLAATGAPAFLLNDAGALPNGMSIFINSLAYRFYPILALVLVFWVALLGRDFGPMKKSQARAQRGEDEHPYETAVSLGDEEAPQPRWWLGLLPILMLVGVTVAVLIWTGLAKTGTGILDDANKQWWEKASDIIAGADPYLCIFYGAILAAITAVLLTLLARACNTRAAIDAGLDGMARMFPAIVILTLAWAISQVEQDLLLAKIVGGELEAAKFPVEWMPLAVFITAAGISFATGTSWTTMAILCPIAVTVTAKMLATAGLDPEHALPLFYGAVGSVLAGAIFGDHCSPISDTTVLSSIAAGCRHEEHVWTQIPYALVTAVVAMGVGDVVCNVYHQPWYYGLGAGAVLLLLWVLIVGRKPKPYIPPSPSSESRWPSPRKLEGS